jgi:outer membrane lipoprotein SlyB
MTSISISIRKLTGAVVLAVLAACSTTSPDVIQRGDAQRLSSVQDAVVINVRPVTVEGSQSGYGGTAGAVAGGVAGSSVGGRREAIVVGVLGAVAGAVVGNAVERGATREQAYEIIVQLRNGERRAIVQAQGNEPFRPGDQVVLVSTGGTTRVTRAQAVQPAAVQPRS